MALHSCPQLRLQSQGDDDAEGDDDDDYFNCESVLHEHFNSNVKNKVSNKQSQDGTLSRMSPKIVYFLYYAVVSKQIMFY